MKRTLSAALSLALAAASASAQVPAPLPAKIGVAAAVSGAVNAVSAGAAVGRVISSGKPLFLNDHVTTDAAGRLQVMLLDETIFTLGPGSDMVLDEFVYDPKTSAGTLSANIAKGTFRFVTGKIAQRDPAKMKVKVAVGTIGVRGSIGVGETGPNGTIIINGGARNPDNHDDAAGIYAFSGGRTVNLIQPGVGTRIGPDGHVENARFMASELNRIMGTLQARTAQAGAVNGRVDLGRHSVTDASGRSTAVGGLLAIDNLVTANLVSSLNSTLVASVQAYNGVTASTWDEIIAGIPSGIGSYSGSGSYSCSGGSCGAGGAGSWDFTTTVNFGEKAITAATFTSETGPASFSGSLNSDNTIAFGTSGPAKFNYTNILGDGSSFSGTTGAFADRSGTIAKDLTVNLQVTTSGATITGAATGSR